MTTGLVPYLPRERLVRRTFLFHSVMLVSGIAARIALGPDPVFVIISYFLPLLILTPIMNWWDYRRGVEMVTLEERVRRRMQDQPPLWLVAGPQGMLYGALMGLFSSTRFPIRDVRDATILVGISAAAALVMSAFYALIEIARRMNANRRSEPLSRFENVAHVLIAFCFTIGFAIAASDFFADRSEAGVAYLIGALVGVAAMFVLLPEPRVQFVAGQPVLGFIFRNNLIVMTLLGFTAAGAIFTFDPTVPPFYYLELAGVVLSASVVLSLLAWAMTGAAGWTPGLPREK